MTRIRKGFTLIELLIVVVIIGILAAIAIPKFANTKTKAYQTAMKSDLRNLVTAEEAFFSDSGYYRGYTQVSAALGDTFLHFKPSTGVSTPTITPYAGAWYAEVTHSQIPAPFKCSIGVNTTNPLVAAAGDGEPVCK
jgi:prepilin-type N-terminal cleavage/methylation domain-containing protein